MKLNRSNFKKQEKKLKNHYKEKERLENFLEHIKSCETIKDLLDNPIYECERLRETLKGYYSFNLCKKGGVIRLIFTIDEYNNIVNLIFISMNHYEDFKRNI